MWSYSHGDGSRMPKLRRLLPGLALAAALALPATALAQADVVEYYHLDALGNVMAVSNAAGAEIESHDYLPFGEEWCGTSVCGTVKAGQPKRFTGKERDAETGLDYYGARYYGSKMGRFTTIDPVYTWQENLVDPQRWNRYAYVRNNPLKYVDPDGRVIETAWDVANIGIGIASLRGNVREGNWGSALLDVLGIVGDSASAAAPGIPGGFGAGIKAVRTADQIRDGVRAGGTAVDASKAAAKFADYNQARNAALDWLKERGFKAERPNLSKFGSKGAPNGMTSADGKIGFRVEYDERNGAHLNVFAGKEKGPHFTFQGTKESVEQIVKRFAN